MVQTVSRSIIVAVVFVLIGMAGAASAAGEQGKATMKVQIPPAPELYNTAPEPLTVQQCGQCHPGQFQGIKDSGGKHRFQCQNCHSRFHVYNPRKANYEEIMPRCDGCHRQPHGATLKDCQTCHTNPHTPRKVAMSDILAKSCPQCHENQSVQLTTFKSKHSKVACNTCHTAHGLIPSCLNCHTQPHVAAKDATTCMQCHPVHRPLQVHYTKDAPSTTCGKCHEKVYGKWRKTGSKHATVNCAVCHAEKHKYVPRCTDCHTKPPHPAGIHIRFPQCLTCHLDPHDLPVEAKR